MDGAFSHEVVHLLMGMRIVFNSRTLADDYSPRTVGGEDQNWVVNCPKLGVHYRLHFVPLVKFNGVLGDIGAEGGS
jgi:hypothetical protein